jgi:caa(3)-type oxidase subunit IV
MSEPFGGNSNSHATTAPPIQGADHGPSFQVYMYVFYALCVLTATSFLANQLLGRGQTTFVVIMLVSIVKATLVAMIFMHLKFDWPRLYCIIIPVCVMGVMMMIVLLPDIVLGWHQYFYDK